MKLDVIIPICNEENNITKLYEECVNALKDIDFNLIFVNDGSSDNSISVLKAIYKKDKTRIKIIDFSRNFGKDAAIYAGLKNSNAKYTAIIDGDLQQDPKYLIKMLKVLEEENYDTVCMIQEQKKKRFFQNLFYKIINKLSETEFINGASDFRMFKNQVVKTLIQLSEKNRFSKGLYSWVGFNTKYLPYTVKERTSGKSKWNFFKLLKYAFEGFINFTTFPLKISVLLGTITSISAFIYLIVVVIKTIISGKDIPGYATIICLILLIGGIQLLCIGFLGQYLSRTYLETKNRPIYIAKEKIGFEENLL